MYITDDHIYLRYTVNFLYLVKLKRSFIATYRNYQAFNYPLIKFEQRSGNK